MKINRTILYDSMLSIFIVALTMLNFDIFWLTAIGFVFTIKSFLKLLRSYESHFPVVEMVISLTYIQLILAPGLYYSLDLSWAGSEKFSMAIPEGEYMFFAVPSILVIQLALNGLTRRIIAAQRSVTEEISCYRNTYQSIGIFIFILGLIGGMLVPWIRPELRFVFYLISLFPYIGFLFLWVSRFIYREILLGVVLGYTLLSAFTSSIFFNAIVWVFFILSFVFYRRNIPMLLKSLIAVFGVYLMFVVQVAKHEYRQDVWSGKSRGGFILFVKKAYSTLGSNDFARLSSLSVLNRLNQGYILAQVMDHTNKTGHKLDQLLKELRGILIPRVLDRNKLSVNTGEKLTYLTGWRVVGGYTMSVGVQGDAYASFGYWGGLSFIFLFFYSLRKITEFILTMSSRIPSLFLWLPLVLFYIVRPGAEFYIISNWILRSIFIVLMMLVILNSMFRRWI